MFGKTARRRYSCLGVGAAITAAVITAAGAPAAQAAPTDCQSGYLCLVKPNGKVVLIPGGQSEGFKHGVPVIEISNNTTNTYCEVLELPNGDPELNVIIAGGDQTFSLPLTVTSVTAAAPLEVCPG
jgi:hypothetical protein